MPILDDKKNQLILSDNEKFYPCFNPQLSGQKDLPNYYFYSNYDNLVSVRYHNGNRNKKPKYIQWLPPLESYKYDKDKNIILDENGNKVIDYRGCRKFVHPLTGANKTIKYYNIGALVFGRDNFLPNVIDRLDEYGIYSFTSDEDSFGLQGHHPTSVSDDKSQRYNHHNISFLVVMYHMLLAKIREQIEKGENIDENIAKMKDMFINDNIK